MGNQILSASTREELTPPSVVTSSSVLLLLLLLLSIHGPFLLSEEIVRDRPHHLPHPLAAPFDAENPVPDLGQAVPVLERVGEEAM